MRGSDCDRTERRGELSVAAGSRKVIFAALVGNALIAVTKFIAAAVTGSSNARNNK